jgi:hypothetical protein
MVAGVGDDSLRPANPYKHWPEPHFKRILNKTKRKSPGKTLQSREFQRVPRKGHLVLMDSSSGEIWIYSDAAFEGKEKPIHWGKLTLGQPVARLNQQGPK